MSFAFKLRPFLWVLAVALATQGQTGPARAAESADATPRMGADGVAHLPASSVPLSKFMSAAARAKFIKAFATPEPSPPPGADIRVVREFDERKNAPLVARAKVLYPVSIEQRVIGGVHVQVITPRGNVSSKNRHRVLINLHGGGFLWGEGNGARAESIPIAGLGKITVITVAYRMAPEFKFPAASEDVAAVYRELLKERDAADIGIYGCSAGGILTAEAIAWFQKVSLPMPGAIGTFCGSAEAIDGDSKYVAPLLVGELPSNLQVPYFSGTSPSDPLVFPANSPAVLARFPPTLLIAGSRDPTGSSLFATQAALSKAGVEAELHVWDGMWHAFFFDPDLPESQEVYNTVVKFFDRHLGAHRGSNSG
jgi:acetyl esterase/lipase